MPQPKKAKLDLSSSTVSVSSKKGSPMKSASSKKQNASAKKQIKAVATDEKSE